ncbi:hypothetical protein EDB80DRAFT_178225 [Ilyonectria destructans]|nr:hypothetical protein EDB80DRAFT_178225 [Ilyonectria destructans]
MDVSMEEQVHQTCHRRLAEIAPNDLMVHTIFRSHLLRDVSTYNIKAKPTRTSNPGHPDSRQPGIIHAKAYNCNKELFGVMFRDYQLSLARVFYHSLPLMTVC